MDERRSDLKRIIMDTKTLPTLPGVITKLNSLSENDKASVQEMARIVASDQVLSARILRLANSPSYGFYRVSTISNAMILLGVNVVKSLALSSSIFEIMEKNSIGLWEHSLGVATAANITAKKLGILEVEEIATAGLLHDIGKIGLPDALLSRSVTDMTGADTVRFRRHPVAGEQALMALEELREAARLVRAHHERHDGKGYPDGLAGEQIPLGARILAIANDYDGLQVGIVAPRKLSPAEARKLIVDSRGKRYDPAVLDLFIEVLDQHQMEANDEQAVSVGRLSPGMVLSRDLVTRQGYLLLATDFVLTAGVIRQIQEYANQEGTENLMIHVRNERRTA